MKCTKAIIPVAGYGTRRLPITKTIEKCMLPILNRPTIDYVVEDCIRAGITDIYFVVGTGATQVKDYYGQNQAMENYLRQHGKPDLVSLVEPPQGVTFHFIEQPTQAGSLFGTTIPVWLCRQFIEPGEHVLVLMGDDFVYNPDGVSEVQRLITLVGDTGVDAAMLGVEVPAEEVSRYGVLATESENGYLRFTHVQEKPSVQEAKSRLINISKYIFGADFWSYLDTAVDREQTGEYYITDPINSYVSDGKTIAVLPVRGQYLDSGTVEGWLHANNVVAQATLHP